MTESAAAALARLYDLDLSEDPGDLDLYLALAARTGGPILELAVGSGRLAVPLADDGHEVTGVDTDPAMLARARAAASVRRHGGPPGPARPGRRPVDPPAAGRRSSSPSSRSTRSSSWEAAPTRRRRSPRSPPTWPRAASRWSTHGSRTPTTSPATTGASCSSGCARIRAPAARVTKTCSAVYDPTTATVLLTTIFEEGHAGEAPPALGPRRPAPPRRDPGRAGVLRRGGRASSSRPSPATTRWATSSRAPSASSWWPASPDARATRPGRPSPAGAARWDHRGPRPRRHPRGRVGPMPDQIRLLVVEDVPQVAQYIRGLLNSQSAIKLLDVVSDGSKVLRAHRRAPPGRGPRGRAAPGPRQGPEPRRPDPPVRPADPGHRAHRPAAARRRGPRQRRSTVSWRMPFTGYELVSRLQQVHQYAQAHRHQRTSRG